MSSSEANPIPSPLFGKFINFRKFLTNKLDLLFLYKSPGSSFYQ